MKKFLNCRGRLLDLSTPKVMGIVNLTPDSFYDGGKISDEKSLLTKVEKMISDGAAIIDVGGQSTRPHSSKMDAKTEWTRIESSLNAIASYFPNAIVSVDTFYSDVAQRAIDAGASIINDISAGNFDPEIITVVAKAGVPYIAMHIKGEPSNMQDKPYYTNVLEEVIQYFVERIEKIRKSGVHDIIIDPGFGFGKNTEHNYTLLNYLNILSMFGLPILAGISRKSMITRVLNVKSEDALNGTTVLNTIALLKGASIIRVHDVKEAVEAISIVQQLNEK